jgi:hypothetical protein
MARTLCGRVTAYQGGLLGTLVPGPLFKMVQGRCHVWPHVRPCLFSANETACCDVVVCRLPRVALWRQRFEPLGGR